MMKYLDDQLVVQQDQQQAQNETRNNNFLPAGDTSKPERRQSTTEINQEIQFEYLNHSTTQTSSPKLALEQFITLIQQNVLNHERALKLIGTRMPLFAAMDETKQWLKLKGRYAPDEEYNLHREKLRVLLIDVEEQMHRAETALSKFDELQKLLQSTLRENCLAKGPDKLLNPEQEKELEQLVEETERWFRVISGEFPPTLEYGRGKSMLDYLLSRLQMMQVQYDALTNKTELKAPTFLKRDISEDIAVPINRPIVPLVAINQNDLTIPSKRPVAVMKTDLQSSRSEQMCPYNDVTETESTHRVPEIDRSSSGSTEPDRHSIKPRQIRSPNDTTETGSNNGMPDYIRSQNDSTEPTHHEDLIIPNRRPGTVFQTNLQADVDPPNPSYLQSTNADIQEIVQQPAMCYQTPTEQDTKEVVQASFERLSTSVVEKVIQSEDIFVDERRSMKFEAQLRDQQLSPFNSISKALVRESIKPRQIRSPNDTMETNSNNGMPDYTHPQNDSTEPTRHNGVPDNTRSHADVIEPSYQKPYHSGYSIQRDSPLSPLELRHNEDLLITKQPCTSETSRPTDYVLSDSKSPKRLQTPDMYFEENHGEHFSIQDSTKSKEPDTESPYTQFTENASSISTVKECVLDTRQSKFDCINWQWDAIAKSETEIDVKPAFSTLSSHMPLTDLLALLRNYEKALLEYTWQLVLTKYHYDGPGNPSIRGINRVLRQTWDDVECFAQPTLQLKLLREKLEKNEAFQTHLADLYGNDERVRELRVAIEQFQGVSRQRLDGMVSQLITCAEWLKAKSKEVEAPYAEMYCCARDDVKAYKKFLVNRHRDLYDALEDFLKTLEEPEISIRSIRESEGANSYRAPKTFNLNRSLELPRFQIQQLHRAETIYVERVVQPEIRRMQSGVTWKKVLSTVYQ